MDRRKAKALVDSIFETHTHAHRATAPRAVAAMEDAKSDIKGIIDEIFDNHTDVITQMRERMEEVLRQDSNSDDKSGR